MAQTGDPSGLHRLLDTAKSIDNKWASAHALGRLASALAVSGDPDDLTRALEPMASFQLPGWRRAAALAMAAAALHRVGAHRRAADLTDEALDAARLEENVELAQRVRHAHQCAVAAFHLGNRPEAERQADLAQSYTSRARPDMYAREELIDLLFDLAKELGAPDRVIRILDLCRLSKDRSLLPRATGEAAVVLARLGRCEPALDHIALSMQNVTALEAATSADLHSDAAFVYHSCGKTDAAADHLAAALKLACTDRTALAGALDTNLDFLTSIDNGATLARIFEALHEVDSWWQA